MQIQEFILKNCATVDTYQDAQHVKTTTLRLDEVNYASYAENLLEEAKSYM